MKKITKAQAIKRFNEGRGIVLCPSNMIPGIPGPYASAAYTLTPATIESWKDRADIYAPRDGQPAFEVWAGSRDRTAWELMLNHWEYYNLDGEISKSTHFYAED